MKANNLIVAFFAEDPPCSAQTCPEMRASEWQYLCAVHDPPKSCCAIDYCCHTLDWAANILTSPKYFPSRLTLGSESSGGPQTSMKHLTNIFRRVYRIFAHAWFQHREVFWQVEGHDGLYIFFKTVCDVYNLIPEDNYTVPKEAEGFQPPSKPDPEHDSNKRMTIMRKESETRAEKPAPDEQSEQTMLNVAATTRRHKATPSVGAIVPTITEAAEDDDDDDDTNKNRQLPDEEDSDLKLPDPSVSETKPGQLSVPSIEAPANDENLTETRAPDDDGMEKSGAITPPPVEPTSESDSQEQSEKPNDSPKQEESNDSPVNNEIDVFEPDTPVDDSKASEVDLPKENPTIPESETPKPENDPSDEITDIDPVSPDLPGSPGSPGAPTTAIEVKAAYSDKPF